MALAVADRAANKNELIVHAAEVIGCSKQRYAVFEAIYTGKTKIKSIEVLMQMLPKLPRTRILDAGKALSDNDLVIQMKANGRTAYTKIEFMQGYRDKILGAACNKKRREAIPTKRSPTRGTSISTTVKYQKAKSQAISVTIDDIDSFAKVKQVPLDLEYVKMPESMFKKGMAKILGEKGGFQDWGGESRDLSSTRLTIKGRRYRCAFAFKGPGKKGRLTPGKMGANGDQIQRLARCSADVYFVQYWAQVDDSVMEQLEDLLKLKSFLDNRKIWFGLIDGQDSARLIQAYPTAFKKG